MIKLLPVAIVDALVDKICTISIIIVIGIIISLVELFAMFNLIIEEHTRLLKLMEDKPSLRAFRYKK